MLQPEKFISIAYQQVDFLIPNDNVISSVGVKDLDVAQLQRGEAGIYDFDEIASVFMQKPRESDLKTMIVMKAEKTEKNNKPGTAGAEDHISIITTQECKVCTIPLQELSLFPDFYSDQFKKFGILACGFQDNRIRLLIDVNQTINYMSDSVLEEL